jgi:hypothetical protein
LQISDKPISRRTDWRKKSGQAICLTWNSPYKKENVVADEMTATTWS